uniref:tyrosine-type recombinase/integrase n=1 Tax=uncultured Sphingomonas sp. TaxID=158754 RepID=UPI0035C9DB16
MRSRIERDLYPAFGHTPIGDIDSAMILRALRKIEARGSIETAKRVRGYILAIFKRAKAERFVTMNSILEIDEIKDALKRGRPGAKHPALTTLPELLELQMAVERSTAGSLTKLASRLLALNAVRVGVLRTALWSEFHGIEWDQPDSDCVDARWTIPAGRMKLAVEDKGKAAFGHEVILSRQAVELLRVVRTMSGGSPLVFPGVKSWRKPMTDATLSSVYRRMAGGGSAV